MLNENEEFLRRLGAMAAKVDAITNCNDLSCVNADNLSRFRAGIPSLRIYLIHGAWTQALRTVRQWAKYWFFCFALFVDPGPEPIPAVKK